MQLKSIGINKPKILLVDDDLISQSVHKNFLVELGYEVDLAKNGKEAFDLIEKPNNYSLILLDINLPDTNGIDITIKIRSQMPNYSSIPIIIITSYNDDEIKQNALSAGANDYLEKPLSKEILSTIINKYNFRKKVLLVEDDSIVQKVHTTMLIKMGCLVDLAENGFKALEKYKTNHYDLILMDEGMPDMNGSEVIAEIRAIEPKNQHIPIVVLTGFSGPEDRKRCLASGADDVYIKPVGIKVLREIVTRKYTNFIF